jgi:hypothetical protein
MVLDLGIGLGEISLGAPATSAIGHPTSSFASIRPPPGLPLPPSLAPNQRQEPSLSSVLPGLTTTSVPAMDDPVSAVLFPVAARAPGATSVYSPRRRVRENPFEDETTARDDDDGDGDDDLMIEAELRELGGRIAGSVLDF